MTTSPEALRKATSRVGELSDRLYRGELIGGTPYATQLASDLRATLTTLQEARDVARDIMNHRLECRAYDQENGHDPREFGDDDFRWIEARAAGLFNSLSAAEVHRALSPGGADE